jgi:hypothetical protein
VVQRGVRISNFVLQGRFAASPSADKDVEAEAIEIVCCQPVLTDMQADRR